MNIFEEVCSMRKRGEDGVLITVVDKAGAGPAVVGKKLLVRKDSVTIGTVGGGDLEHVAVKKAQELLQTKENFIETYDFSGKDSVGDAVKLNMVCGGTATLYYEYIGPMPTVYIFGVGHVGKRLAMLLKQLDYSIVLVDDRESIIPEELKDEQFYFGDYTDVINKLNFKDESFVIISAYSHEIEYQVLKALYQKGCNAKYIGILASAKKADYMLRKLEKELLYEVDFSNIYAPIGLDIGGKSPEEVALSIAAELQALRHGKKGHKHMTFLWSREKNI